MLVNRRAKYSAGFTLIEIMVAVVLLTIIISIIYGSFSSVVRGIERARIVSDRLKTEQFVSRVFAQNLAQATEGWSPGAAYRKFNAATAGGANRDEVDRGEMRFPFMGKKESGLDGPRPSLTFASSAPMAGVGSLPGQIKLCSYSLEKDDAAEESDASDPFEEENAPQQLLLTLTETVWTSTGTGLERDFTNPEQATELIKKDAEDAGLESVTRSVPVYAWELAYFDGKEWQETWDSQQGGRLPWTVRVRVKLEQEEGEDTRAEKLDPEEDPSVIEMFFSVPAGLGVFDAPPDYVRATDREQPRA